MLLFLLLLLLPLLLLLLSLSLTLSLSLSLIKRWPLKAYAIRNNGQSLVWSISSIILLLPPVCWNLRTASPLKLSQLDAFNPGYCGRWPDPMASDRPASSTRVSNGRPIKQGEIPALVMIHARKSKNRINRCGGILIHSDLVLTAGHCVKGSSENDTIFTFGYGSGQAESISLGSRKVCTNFDDNSPPFLPDRQARQDLAVIQLAHKVHRYSDLVSPACLFEPHSSQFMNSVENYSECFVAGFGRTKKEQQGRGNLLYGMPVANTCDEFEKEFESADTTCIKSSRPTYYTGTLCQGDSGSGVLCYDSEFKRSFVVGIESLASIDCPTWPPMAAYMTDIRKGRADLLDLLTNCIGIHDDLGPEIDDHQHPEQGL